MGKDLEGYYVIYNIEDDTYACTLQYFKKKEKRTMWQKVLGINMSVTGKSMWKKGTDDTYRCKINAIDYLETMCLTGYTMSTFDFENMETGEINQLLFINREIKATCGYNGILIVPVVYLGMIGVWRPKFAEAIKLRNP